MRNRLSELRGDSKKPRDNGSEITKRDKAGGSLSIEEPEALARLTPQSWRGQLSLHVRADAPAWRYLKQVAAVLVREFDFYAAGELTVGGIHVAGIERGPAE